jgi:hypothetical protein
MLFLYDLPNWLMGVAVVGTIVIVSYALYFAVHALLKPDVTDDHKGIAMAVLAIVATMNSLLLAFSAVSVWDAYGAADEAVVAEATTISALARDLAVFDSAHATKARAMLRQYTQMVITDEWETMHRGEADPATWTYFDAMFREIAALELDTTRRETLMYEVFQRTNELLKERRVRLYSATSEVPGTLWAVVLIGTVLSMATTFVLPPTRFNVTMIGALALSIGLVFYFIVAMDRPFAGKESISADPFVIAIENIDRWDRETSLGSDARR